MFEPVDLTKALANKRISRRTFLMGMAGSAALGILGSGIASCSSGAAPAPTAAGAGASAAPKRHHQP
ncbi:MAG: hypothetical protein M1343_09480 [Chloroflexi bacterium]|nr:hypothetical protein [Chloroflexota bacterium]